MVKCLCPLCRRSNGLDDFSGCFQAYFLGMLGPGKGLVVTVPLAVSVSQMNTEDFRSATFEFSEGRDQVSFVCTVCPVPRPPKTAVVIK